MATLPRRARALTVWMNGERIGEWSGTASNITRFTYDVSWWASPNARPLSLSMPRLPGNAAHRGAHVTAWFENLLPDAPAIRERLRKRFATRSTEALDLLAAIGRDCVGAVQLLPPDEVPPQIREIDAIPLTDGDVAARLRTVTSGPPLGGAITGSEPFRISIAGAQEKTALLWHDGRWHEPRGATPTTHILKLPLGLVGNMRANMQHSVENEWLCLRLLSMWGLPAAKAEIATFADAVSTERVLVVERFDRRPQRDASGAAQWIARLPQEDLCQAFGRSRDEKYETDGGPGIPDILGLLARSTNAADDVRTFVLAQLANWLLAAPDGHAKNYSVFLTRDGYAMTPLYDVLSAWPIIGTGPNEWAEQDVTLSMGLRGKSVHRELRRIATRHWHALAVQSGVQGMFEIMQTFVARAEGALDPMAGQLPAGFPMGVWERIADGVRRQCERFRLGLQYVNEARQGP